MARPWYKRDGAAFIQGTMGLTLEEKGAYSICLDLIYSNGGPIADDARWLAGVCGVSLRKWTALRSSLIERGKLFADGGRLMNARAVSEIASLDRENPGETPAKSPPNLSEPASKHVRKGGENEVRLSENKDLLGGDKNREDIEEKKKKVSAAPVGADTLLPIPAKSPPKSKGPKPEPEGFPAFYAAYPLHKARPAAAKAYAAALTRAPPATLLEGASRYAISRQGEDPKFTKHPATWLNQDCWLDEDESHGTGSSKSGRGSSHANHRAGWSALIDAEGSRSKASDGPRQLALGAPETG